MAHHVKLSKRERAAQLPFAGRVHKWRRVWVAAKATKINVRQIKWVKTVELATDASELRNPELEVIKAPDARPPLPKIHRKVAEPVQPRQRSTRVRMIGPGGYAELEMDDPMLDGPPPTASSGPPAWALQNGGASVAQAVSRPVGRPPGQPPGHAVGMGGPRPGMLGAAGAPGYRPILMPGASGLPVQPAQALPGGAPTNLPAVLTAQPSAMPGPQSVPQQGLPDILREPGKLPGIMEQPSSQL